MQVLTCFITECQWVNFLLPLSLNCLFCKMGTTLLSRVLIRWFIRGFWHFSVLMWWWWCSITKQGWPQGTTSRKKCRPSCGVYHRHADESVQGWSVRTVAETELVLSRLLGALRLSLPWVTRVSWSSLLSAPSLLLRMSFSQPWLWKEKSGLFLTEGNFSAQAP